MLLVAHLYPSGPILQRAWADFQMKYWHLFAWGPLTATKQCLTGVVYKYRTSFLLRWGKSEPLEFWEAIHAISLNLPHGIKLQSLTVIVGFICCLPVLLSFP